MTESGKGLSPPVASRSPKYISDQRETSYPAGRLVLPPPSFNQLVPINALERILAQQTWGGYAGSLLLRCEITALQCRGDPREGCRYTEAPITGDYGPRNATRNAKSLVARYSAHLY